jgi:hypothetical protein
MAKRKIIWSHRANIKLFEILDFYANRNGNTTYSTKLYRRIVKELSLLDKYPQLGIKTDFELIRGLIVADFTLFYEITDKSIYIHTIWDCRQNPNDLKIE